MIDEINDSCDRYSKHQNTIIETAKDLHSSDKKLLRKQISDYIVVNFDEVVNDFFEYLQKDSKYPNAAHEKPASVDALFWNKDNHPILVEFKNQAILKRSKNDSNNNSSNSNWSTNIKDIHMKFVHSAIMLSMIENQLISNLNKELIFVLVYSEKKQAEKDSLESGWINRFTEELASLSEIAFSKFQMYRLEKYCAKEIKVMSFSEFNNYFENNYSAINTKEHINK